MCEHRQNQLHTKCTHGIHYEHVHFVITEETEGGDDGLAPVLLIHVPEVITLFKAADHAEVTTYQKFSLGPPLQFFLQSLS